MRNNFNEPTRLNNGILISSKSRVVRDWVRWSKLGINFYGEHTIQAMGKKIELAASFKPDKNEMAYEYALDVCFVGKLPNGDHFFYSVTLNCNSKSELEDEVWYEGSYFINKIDLSE